MKVKTTGSSDETNLALQPLDGEVMDAKMANFIGIHMINEITVTDDRPPFTKDFGYPNPCTNAHFEYHDLCQRLNLLQKRRAVIDQAILEELKFEQLSQQPVKLHRTEGDYLKQRA